MGSLLIPMSFTDDNTLFTCSLKAFRIDVIHQTHQPACFIEEHGDIEEEACEPSTRESHHPTRASCKPTHIHTIHIKQT